MPNLEDFLSENPDFVQKIELHDRSIGSAEERATAFYAMLLAAPIFNKDVNEAFGKYETNIMGNQPLAQSIESIKEQLPKFVAENLINNARELPAHYTIHSFWKRFVSEFQKYLLEFEGYKGRQSFRELEQATAALVESSSNLLRDLESRRQTLCREFDIPAAPPVSVPTSAEYM